MRNRIIFHSIEDLSSGYYLKKSEELLSNLDLNKKLEINNLLEFYHVKKYFDNEIFLTSWDDTTKANFIQKINEANKVTQKNLAAIDQTTIKTAIKELEYFYVETFWTLINNLNTYKKIEKPTFVSILGTHTQHIRYILNCKKIVDHFDKQLKDFLISYDKSAELILARYEEENKFGRTTAYNFPSNLTLEDKETIISNYIDSVDVNLNYIRLIENSKDSDVLRLSTKVRLKAKKKSEELNREVLEGTSSWTEGIKISLDKDQIEPFEFSQNEHLLEISYSEAYLDKFETDYHLFFIFSELFKFIDKQDRITLVHKYHEMDVLERTLMKSKNEYPRSYTFRRKNDLAYLQLHIFNIYLSKRNRSIEKIIEAFIETFLRSECSIQNLRFKLPAEDSTYQDKIRMLAPEFEYLLKQYQIYVDEEQIDHELLGLNSNPLRLSEIKGLDKKKYVYISNDNDRMQYLEYHFFSDQSPFIYLDQVSSQYKNLFEHLVEKTVNLDSFEEYQMDIINKLIDQKYLYLDKDNNVRVTNVIFIFLVGELYRNDVLSYWHYSEKARNIIDEMVDSGLLTFENTLFTRQEVNYFNFYLNKKEFTNGFDIRNKYLHGTNSSSEKEQERDYYLFLMLVILALLKIQNDLLISKQLKK